MYSTALGVGSSGDVPHCLSISSVAHDNTQELVGTGNLNTVSSPVQLAVSARLQHLDPTPGRPAADVRLYKTRATSIALCLSLLLLLCRALLVGKRAGLTGSTWHMQAIIWLSILSASLLLLP
jgi:hypothetical protein